MQLMKSSTWTRRSALGKTSGDASDKVLTTIWEGPCEEADKGWLSGPYKESELVELLGPMFVVSRRFGLEQTDKTRAIDDMSDSLVAQPLEADGISTTARWC